MILTATRHKLNELKLVSLTFEIQLQLPRKTMLILALQLKQINGPIQTVLITMTKSPGCSTLENPNILVLLKLDKDSAELKGMELNGLASLCTMARMSGDSG